MAEVAPAQPAAAQPATPVEVAVDAGGAAEASASGQSEASPGPSSPSRILSNIGGLRRGPVGQPRAILPSSPRPSCRAGKQLSQAGKRVGEKIAGALSRQGTSDELPPAPGDAKAARGKSPAAKTAAHNPKLLRTQPQFPRAIALKSTVAAARTVNPDYTLVGAVQVCTPRSMFLAAHGTQLAAPSSGTAWHSLWHDAHPGPG